MTVDPTIVRTTLLEVLSDVRLWRLTTARWPEVDDLLADLQAALASGAYDDAAAVAAELEVLGPVRVIPAGSAPRPEPAPAQVLERLNHLVHALGDVATRPDRRPEPRPEPRR